MADANEPSGAGDPHNLSRFVQAQEDDYEQALSEIRSGTKRTHWMWYIFPQLDGLALSSTAKRYAIKSIEEAKAYVAHPLLGPRLLECAEAVIDIEWALGADIIMAFDECPPYPCPPEEARRSMERTHRWERRCRDRWLSLCATEDSPAAPAEVDQATLQRSRVVSQS